jgi:glycerol-3-phosphate acyltransferase PlsY
MPSSDPKFLVLWCLAAFLCGSIPFGLLLVKLAGKGDVRAHGSGNIGATNVSRVGGKGLGLVTLLLDIAKGFLPVFLGRQLGMNDSLLSVLALCAVLGHVFTPWLKFQGGKGVATALGVALAFRAVVVLPALGLFIVMAALVLPLALWRLGAPPMVLLLWAAISLLVIAKHHENIRRLLKGTEAPLWGAKQEAPHVQG